MVKPSLFEGGNFSKVTELAAEAMAVVRKVRG